MHYLRRPCSVRRMISMEDRESPGAAAGMAAAAAAAAVGVAGFLAGTAGSSFKPN